MKVDEALITMLGVMVCGSASCAREHVQQPMELLDTTFESADLVHQALGPPAQQQQTGGRLHETYFIKGEVIEVHYSDAVD